MYTILQELKGTIIEYSVVDNRTYKVVYTCIFKEDAVKFIQQQEAALYKD